MPGSGTRPAMLSLHSLRLEQVANKRVVRTFLDYILAESQRVLEFD